MPYGFSGVTQVPTDAPYGSSTATPPPAQQPFVASGGSAPPVLTNTAAKSPYLEEQLNLLRLRMSADPTKRAIDRSNLGVADSAALLAKDAKANMGSRGVIGTEVGDAYLGKNVFRPAQQLAAGKAADIALGRERDLDAMVLGSQGIFQAPDQFSLANRRLALDQYSAQSTDQARRADAAQRARDSEIARWLALQGLSGGGPSGGPVPF